MPTPCSHRALFAISSLGLGHATRSLTIIHEYIDRGYALTLVSSGNALAFLKQELSGQPTIEFKEMADYPPLERGNGWRLYAYLALDLIKTWIRIRREHHYIETIAASYDFIFSDGRYGFYSHWAPSFILSHQIAFIPPRRLRGVSWIIEHLNISALRHFDHLFIPDYPNPDTSLAGNLAHTPNLHRTQHSFIGILSSYPHLDLPRDIDYLFILSGYLLEHKGSLILSLLGQAQDLPGKKVFILGNADNPASNYMKFSRDDLAIYAVAAGTLRYELFNRACCIISRAGYTTVMDLVEHGKQALLIPTPNQTEQEYLAYYLGSLGHFAARPQKETHNLLKALQECSQTRLFHPPWKTADSLKKISEVIDRQTHQHFISVIVPAHNEEDELAATLYCLLRQHYPPEYMQIIVVENGSTDATLEIARRIAASPPGQGRIQVLQSARGVSRARNAGLAALSPESEWVILCDADTRLKTHFLRHLNVWLNRYADHGLSIGTAAIHPHPGNHWYARTWFRIFNLIHRLTKTSFAIQIARTAVARDIGYREDLHLAEDLTFLREARRYGRFFFLPTNQVSTSIRRFKARGFLRQGVRWVIEALLPMRLKSHRPYDVIR